jgi:hypothetical protein
MNVSITLAFKYPEEIIYWENCLEEIVSNFKNRILEQEPGYCTFRLLDTSYAEAIALFGIFLTANERILFVIS